MTEAAAIPVGIWLRVSTEMQVQADSPENHERRARMYAEARGWTVEKVYRLEGVSGKAVADHPETERMMEDVKNGVIGGLIFSKLARLARNTRELLDFADYFQKHDADLISLDEAIDTSTPAGRLFYTVIAAMAQWEREEIAERVRKSVKTRAELGKPLGGAAPFGFRWENKELVPDPDEAPVRKLMFELFLEEKRKKTVARRLNEMGYRTRRGAKFSDTTVDRLLRAPIAKGLRRTNYTRSKGEGKSWEFKPEEEWIWQEVEPIVDEETWDQVNAFLNEQRKSRKKIAKKPVQLFAGVTVCECGTTMYVPSNTPKYVCYECRNKIPIEDLDEIFHEQLKSFVFSPDEIAEYLSQADEAIKEKEALLAKLEREKASTEREMEQVYRAYIDEEISVKSYGKQYRPLEERLEQLEEETPRLQGEIDFLKIQYLSSDEVVSEARDLYGRWGDLAFDDKRRIVETVVESIEIGSGEVAIELAYLPSSLEVVANRQRNNRGSSPRSA